MIGKISGRVWLLLNITFFAIALYFLADSVNAIKSAFDEHAARTFHKSLLFWDVVGGLAGLVVIGLRNFGKVLQLIIASGAMLHVIGLILPARLFGDVNENAVNWICMVFVTGMVVFFVFNMQPRGCVNGQRLENGHCVNVTAVPTKPLVCRNGQQPSEGQCVDEATVVPAPTPTCPEGKQLQGEHCVEIVTVAPPAETPKPPVRVPASTGTVPAATSSGSAPSSPSSRPVSRAPSPAPRSAQPECFVFNNKLTCL